MAFASPTRNRRRGRAPLAEINVTPLVDVMLVLLVIFMVTAPLLTAGVPVNLPDSAAKALPQEPKQVMLSLEADGRLFLDRREVPGGDLPQALAGLPKDADGRMPQVTLRADRGLDYGRVMGVMGDLNRAGFNRIALVTNAHAPVSGRSPVGP